MNSLLKSIILMSAVTSMNIYAAPELACRLRLTPKQITEKQELNREALLKIKELRPEIKIAKLELKKVLVASNSTKEEAQAAQKALEEKQEQLKAVKSDTEIAILFDVLTPEQRVKLQKCPEREIRIREPRIPHHRGPRVEHRHRPGRIDRHHGPHRPHRQPQHRGHHGRRDPRHL